MRGSSANPGIMWLSSHDTSSARSAHVSQTAQAASVLWHAMSMHGCMLMRRRSTQALKQGISLLHVAETVSLKATIFFLHALSFAKSVLFCHIMHAHAHGHAWMHFEHGALQRHFGETVCRHARSSATPQHNPWFLQNRLQGQAPFLDIAVAADASALSDTHTSTPPLPCLLLHRTPPPRSADQIDLQVAIAGALSCNYWLTCMSIRSIYIYIYIYLSLSVHGRLLFDCLDIRFACLSVPFNSRL